MTDAHYPAAVSEETVRSLIAKLAHDVGKHIARTAVNLPHFPKSDALTALLVADLYCLNGAARASAVFEKYASPIEAHLGPSEHLEVCRRHLRRIDALEADVRSGEPSALEEAGALALAVSEIIIRLRDEHGRA